MLIQALLLKVIFRFKQIKDMFLDKFDFKRKEDCETYF
jgi:hypothetical protein